MDATALTKAETYKTRANTYYPIQDEITGYWYPCDPDRVWAYATESRVKLGTKLRSETIEELIRKKEIYFPACKPSDVMQWDTLDELKKAIRAGKGPVLPKKKTPLLREDLPDLEFWVGKPIAPGRPSRKDYLKRKKKMVAPVSSWIAGKKEEIDYLYDEMEEQVELMRSERGGEGTDAINAILGTKAFNHPKPPSLIRALVGQASTKDDLVVDFFAGSGTTAQAVLECNQADGTEGQRRFILVSTSEVTEGEPTKNVCRDVCAKRVKNVIQGYGSVPGLGGNFAYLRCRRIAPGRLVEIEHAQVWTALQLIHRETIESFTNAGFLWAGDDETGLVYVPRFTEELVSALRKAVKDSAAVTIYSWQPETLSQYIRDGHVQHEAIPESLARRFGMKG